MKNKQKEIPIINGGFRPSMADLSLMIDECLNSEDVGLQKLGQKTSQILFTIFELYEIYKEIINDSHTKENA